LVQPLSDNEWNFARLREAVKEFVRARIWFLEKVVAQAEPDDAIREVAASSGRAARAYESHDVVVSKSLLAGTGGGAWKRRVGVGSRLAVVESAAGRSGGPRTDGTPRGSE
jgi:hypothetical protein